MRHALAMVMFLSLQRGLFAQSALATSDAVRITSTRHELRQQTGNVLAATTDTIVVQMHATPTVLALPVAAIDRLEVQRRERHARHGARIGAALGMAGGLAYGLAHYQKCQSAYFEFLDFSCELASRGTNALVGALAGSVVGAAVGALAGHAIRSDTWVEIPTRHPALSVRGLRAGGVGVGVALSF